ncbi:peptide deformylase [Paracoccaceae bacterium Fryx2]|nr:peptide deformylase [Paracoccaceae bacterium Fryx2]
MALLPILRWPDPRLSMVCAPCTGNLSALAADMLETMYAAPGRGLAGPQVGAMLRILVMDVGWKEGTPQPRVLLNPEILWRDDTVATGAEGCLSIPGTLPLITRATAIRLRWQDLDGTACDDTLTGFAAICAQHEIDHLDGILTLDRLTPEARAVAVTEAGAAP